MLLQNNYGISWSTFPKQGAPLAEQIAAQTEICWAVTSTIDTIANQTLRATLGTEVEQGPDFTVAVRSNGWVRMRLSRWPILQLVSAQFSPSGAAPPTWQPIPLTALMTEHSALPALGTIVASGAGPGPTAVLVGPGYVNWFNGRNGYLLSITYINGYPLAGIDQTAVAGATSIHVDDITGWWNGTAGARGTIQDTLNRESVTVTGVTPDVPGATTGPGTMAITPALQFTHTPTVGQANTPDQTILITTLPSAVIMACYYLAVYFGLIRGTTAATVQVGRGAIQSTSGGAQTWYDRAARIIANYARVF